MVGIDFGLRDWQMNDNAGSDLIPRHTDPIEIERSETRVWALFCQWCLCGEDCFKVDER